MKSEFFCILAGLLLFSCRQVKDVSRIQLDEISFTEKEEVINSAINSFSFDLFHRMSFLDSTENMFVSPFSISCALGMVNNGASGITHHEITRVMHIPDSLASSLNDYHLKLMDGLPCLDSSVTVKIANSMWLNKKVEVNKKFKQKNSTAYKAVSRLLDFSKSESVDEINRWVSRQTEDCIPEIISDLTPDNLMVLVNCIYFQGYWEFPFEESDTHKEQFFCADKTIKYVDMMHQMASFQYRKNDFFEMATFPYGNGSYAMTVLLPNVDKSWRECMDMLDGNRWETWMSDSTDNMMLDVKLPKLVLKNKYQMKEVLSAMGMTNAFTPHADFTGITEKMPVWIEEVIHASYLELNEKETKASAATVLEVTFESEWVPIGPVIPFYANRPFLLVIHETGNNTILFIGKVFYPEK